MTCGGEGQGNLRYKQMNLISYQLQYNESDVHPVLGVNIKLENSVYRYKWFAVNTKVYIYLMYN